MSLDWERNNKNRRLSDNHESIRVMSDTSIFRFGKYRGRTLKNVRAIDPSYVNWCVNNSVIEIRGDK